MTGLAAIALGLLVGVGSGGSLARLAEIRLHLGWTLLAAFVVQAWARGRLGIGAGSSWAIPVWVTVSVLLIALLAVNWASPGALIAACGLTINVDVVLLNRGMPVVTEAGFAAVSAVARSGGFYNLAGASTIGAWAGDVLAVSLLGHTELLSVGDVLLIVGIAVVIAGSMLHSSSPSRATGLGVVTQQPML